MTLAYAPVNFVPGTQAIEANTKKAIAGLSILDVDADSNLLTTTLSVLHGALTFDATGGATISGNGTATVTLSGTMTEINAALTLPGNLTYRGTTDYFGDDTLTITTNDGEKTDADQVAIRVKSLLTGTERDDTFAALPGNERIDALGGVDTVRFDFKLTDANVKFAGDKVIVDGPSSHTVLTGVETFIFTDGTVNNNDANPLVDDLFYFSQNHDVWNAQVDPDQHYGQFGWKEGRDPNALFDAAGYLSTYADVKAAGVNPFGHYHEFGWREGRDPSPDFDTSAYLAAYPDVAAAGIDPLAHFLQFGIHEGRSAFADGVWG
jgi:hypothetical protein